MPGGTTTERVLKFREKVRAAAEEKCSIVGGYSERLELHSTNSMMLASEQRVELQLIEQLSGERLGGTSQDG